MAKHAVTIRELSADGTLYKDLERLGLDASIDIGLDVSITRIRLITIRFLPDNYVYPQLAGGLAFTHGGICIEPLTKDWAPSMTIPSLCVAIKVILDHGDVHVSGVDNKAGFRLVGQFHAFYCVLKNGHKGGK